MTQPFRIALAGLGTVGTGVLRMLDTHGAQIAERAGRPIEVVAVSARSRSRDRGVDISRHAWADDPVTLATRDGIDCLVEVMGGEDGPAKAAVEAALDAGRHVVTANKAMLARHGTGMAARAEANGAALRFEAAVAGGIPVVKALGEGLVGNAITRVLGVMNGTCNYILTEMARSGADYADVLAEAQRLGYAEADPEADVGGFDAAHKLALLAAIAFGTEVDFDGVEIDGIHRITLADIRQAADMGYRIKLLGVARMNADGLEQRMQPCLVPAASALGQLDGVTNAVAIEGDFIGQIALEGPGAGAGPTASAILGDLVDIARGVNRPALGRAAHALRRAERSQTGSEAAYYLRLALRDAPGTLARVATCLGEGEISIDMMRQY
ncbi:MAG: homoserine dehydrogenase, partial [Pseudomonadota bacterium]